MSPRAECEDCQKVIRDVSWMRLQIKCLKHHEKSAEPGQIHRCRSFILFRNLYVKKDEFEVGDAIFASGKMESWKLYYESDPFSPQH
jgi:hypothetical protein